MLCLEYVETANVTDLSEIDNFTKLDIPKSKRICEILSINQEYGMNPLLDIVDLAAHRQMAIGAFM